MNSAEKQQAIGDLAEQFAKAQSAYLFDHNKVSCSDMTVLRGKLRQGGAKLKIVKNTLAKKAAQGSSAELLSEMFTGPTAVIYSEGDPVTPAKALREFAKDREGFVVKGGFVDGALVSARDIEALAAMPSKDQLLGQLLGLLNAPATKLLQTINAPASSVARVLGAWCSEREKTGK